MILFLLTWLGLVLIRPQEYPALADMGLPLLPIAMLAALAAWMLGNQRRPLIQPTYLLLAAFVVVGMLSMVANGWVGGARIRFFQFLPALITLLLVTQACHLPRNCLRIMWMIALCAVVLTIHGIEQVKLGQGWTGMPTVQDGRIQYVGIFSDPNDLASSSSPSWRCSRAPGRALSCAGCSGGAWRGCCCTGVPDRFAGRLPGHAGDDRGCCGCAAAAGRQLAGHSAWPG